MPQLLTNNKRSDDEFKVIEQLPMISYTLSVMSVISLLVNYIVVAVEFLVYIMDGFLCLISETISMIESRSRNDE